MEKGQLSDSQTSRKGALSCKTFPDEAQDNWMHSRTARCSSHGHSLLPASSGLLHQNINQSPYDADEGKRRGLPSMLLAMAQER